MTRSVNVKKVDNVDYFVENIPKTAQNFHKLPDIWQIRYILKQKS